MPLTVEVETSQSTQSLSPSAIDRSPKRSRSPRRSNSPDVFPPPEEEEAIYSDLDPDEAALAAARDQKRNGQDSKSFKSRAKSPERSSTLSREKSIKKINPHKNSPDSRSSNDQHQTSNSSQKVVHHKGQPTATPVLIYEETRREMVQQYTANLMSVSHNHYGHIEVIADSYTSRYEDMLYSFDRAKREDCSN